MLHPIVAQTRPSKEQEPAITTRGRDIVVTAGAGTGKTRTLVARYLSLLAEGLPLRSIIAITFTRKAAREMRNRVRDTVRRYLEGSDLGAEERERWQSLYSQLDAARIGTIHSLCTEILRSHPAEARVDPRFEVLEEGQVNILRLQAVNEALAWAADDEQAAALFGLMGERILRITLEGLLGGRLDAQEVLGSIPGDLMGHWRQALEERQTQLLSGLEARPEWSEAVEVLLGNAADDPEDLAEIQRQGAVAALEVAEGSLPDQLASLVRLSDISLSGGRQAAWPGGKEQLGEVKSALRTLRELWKEEAELLTLALNPLDEGLAATYPALRATFEFACDRYSAFRRERNALDFDDLERGALTLLQDNMSIRSRWQDDVRALLVDEFQDTNSRQRDLIALLNGEGEKLFIVGDAKQSIYRFRGADVTVFRAERERIVQEGGAGIPLHRSFRAHRDLIAGLNALLEPVLGEEDPSRPWVEPFAPLDYHREEPGSGFAPPHVELHLTVGAKSRGALDRAANALAARLLSLMGSDLEVWGEGATRPLDYGDIAVLCRASTSFNSYEDALERAGIPFLTVAGRGFYRRPEIRDLLNGLQALADPTDDLALVGLLRSPGMGLSDAELYDLREKRGEDGSSPPLWDVLQEAGGHASRAAELIRSLHDQVGRSPVADVLKGLLDGTGYRAALLETGGARAARNVDKLLADGHASGITGVGEFLEYVQGLRDSGTREGEARATAEGAVQIMTVHQAKGLEFPVVVLGDATRGPHGGGSLLVQPRLGVLVGLKDEEKNQPAAFLLGREIDRDQDEAESDRLLYVAATRAREKLILSACIGLTRDGEVGKPSGWMGRLAEPLGLTGTEVGYDEEGSGAIQLDLRAGIIPVACTIYEPQHPWEQVAPELKTVRERPVELPPPLLAPIEPGQEQVDAETAGQERDPPQRVWRVVPAVKRPRAPAWVVGSLVHEALAAWRFPDGGFELWAEARARGHGITDADQLVDAVRQSRRLLERFQTHPLFEEMDGADRRLHEVPYTVVVDDRPESGIIDALYQQDGTWTMVEFKTDRVQDQVQLDRLLAEDDYLAQVERYVSAAEGLLGTQPRPILCMLNYGGAVHLHEVE
jgi:ATP-dependent helicase/nuclease subunit A